ncbi:glutamate ABC transporter substrate-binding protein [Streptomyces gilvosporeus]|nr:glutamate ABC transporter substrate-binding protein [Streptomyces gilvosporeus]
MSLRRPCIAATIAVCALAVAGCSDTQSAQPSDVNTAASFASGSSMDKLRASGRIRIGVKFDQPGMGYKKAGSHEPSGFDIEIAKIVAGGLGIQPNKIQWVQTTSQNREKFLESGKVDLVVASYTMNNARRAVVGQAGPYFVTGQQLLVRKDRGISGAKDVKGKKVCAAKGSTSVRAIKNSYQATPVQLATYGQCVAQLRGGSVDAVSTDGAILLGYAAQDPRELEVVGEPIDEAGYGVGYRKGDTGMCNFIDDTLQKAFRNGSWDNALMTTLWKTSGLLPRHPDVMESCTGSGTAS